MKKMTLGLLMGTVLLGYSASALAQREISIGDYLSPTHSSLMTNSKTNLLESPFLSTDWLVGNIVLENGQQYQDVQFNYDQSSESLVLMVKGNAYTPNAPVQSVTYEDKSGQVVLKSGYSPEKNILFRVLHEGNTILLKRTKKSKSQRSDHFTGNTEVKFIVKTDYYLFIDNKLLEINPTKKGLLSVLGKRKPAIKTYLETQDSNLKDDRVLADLIAHYDTL
ncbi:hypothetical protein [Parapedobacter lycopersici]|uniref:hypothetical protein n=1 Tax=Parapedobacter lycopersici TaxID=1864939 RepID=UPI0033400E3D